MNRIKMVGAATAGALALSMTGLAATAHADTAADVQIMLANLPDGVQTLVAGTQTALDNFATSQSVDQLGFNLIQAVQFAVNDITDGTEQFGSLGLGVALALAGPYSILQPYLQALDADPASVLDLLDPNDLSTLLANLPAAIAAAQPAAVDALTELLRGNLSEGTGSFGGLGTPAVIGSGLESLTTLLQALATGTSFEFTLPIGVVSPLLVVAIATAGYVQDAEAQLAPVFDALAPVTDPIIVALEGL